LNADVAPSEFLAAAQQEPAGFGSDGLGNGAPSRSRARTNSSTNPPPTARSSTVQHSNINLNNGGNLAVGSAPNNEPDTQNARALEVLDRVAQKLTGRDFKMHVHDKGGVGEQGQGSDELDVVSQVTKLIGDATNLENLCQHYIGWCSFW
jgi:serine/threonine-protein kinase mTOR